MFSRVKTVFRGNCSAFGTLPRPVYGMGMGALQKICEHSRNSVMQAVDFSGKIQVTCDMYRMYVYSLILLSRGPTKVGSTQVS